MLSTKMYRTYFGPRCRASLFLWEDVCPVVHGTETQTKPVCFFGRMFAQLFMVRKHKEGYIWIQTEHHIILFHFIRHVRF